MLKNCCCKYCGSINCNEDGIVYNKQRYYCKDCLKHFRLGDNRIKHDIKERELVLLLYSHNMSLRSIQSIVEKYYDIKISFNLIQKWIKSFSKLLQLDINIKKEIIQKEEKPRTIEILELDEA